MTLSIVNSLAQHDCMKHVQLDRNSIKSEIGGGINLQYVPTKIKSWYFAKIISWQIFIIGLRMSVGNVVSLKIVINIVGW